MTQIKRVVTGHDKDGKAIVLSDGPVPTVHNNPIVWLEAARSR